MSFMDTGDDELDYGEEELGDHDAPPTSFQPGAAISALADDEMAQDEDYEDLYDDVNIGYFQAPAEISKDKAVDAGNVFGLQYDEEESYDRTEGTVPGIHADEPKANLRVAAVQEPVVAAVSEPQIKELKELKEESKHGMEQVDVAPIPRSKEEINHSYSAQQFKEAAFPSSVVENVDEKDQSLHSEQRNFSSRLTEQGDNYSNGSRQRIQGDQLDKPSFSPNKDKETRTAAALPPPGSGEINLGTSQLVSGTNYESGASAGRGYYASSAKIPGGVNAKGRGATTEMPFDGGRGNPTGPSKPPQSSTQRDSSPNLVNDSAPRHTGQQSYSGDGGGNMLFVGDLHWWTTDAELEAALSEYGRVKNLKFFEERVSGKSKGYCQVEFYDHASAASCKQGMNGKRFHDRSCVVQFGNARSIQQMGFAQERKAQAQFQAQQAQMPSRRNAYDSGGARGGSYQEREGGRAYGGRTGTVGRTGQGKGNQTGPGRGRGNYMSKGMSSAGSSGAAGAPYGQGHSGHMGGHQSGMMMHQGIIGQGYDPGYGPPMGRGGAAYSGYVMPGPPFSGMVQPFPTLGPGGLPGVAPHVNPAFFGRSAAANGMGMMSGGGMEGPHQGLWGEATMSGWTGEEHDRRVRDGSYGEDVGGMDYGYSSEMGHEKGRTSGGRDKENGDWAERRRRDERDADWERERYRDRDRDAYRDQRDRERERDKDDDWERDRVVRMRNKTRMMGEEEDEDQRLRSREEDYGKRRRMAVERDKSGA